MNYHYLKHLARAGHTNVHPKGVQATELLIDRLNLREGQNILELGCGTGETLVRICSRNHVKITGVDILDEMVCAAYKRTLFTRLSNIQVIKIAENEELPFPDNSFDRIYCESVLGIQHRESLNFMLSQVYRKLKRGGVFIANEAIWREATPIDTIATVNKENRNDFGVRQATQEPLYIADWLALFKNTGFTTISSKLLEDEHLSWMPKTGRRHLFLSKLFTAYRRLLVLLNPRFHLDKYKYAQLLEKHTHDGFYIEARFFVLTKHYID